MSIVADGGTGRRYSRDFQVKPSPTSCRFPWLPVGTWRFELQALHGSQWETEASTVVDVVEGKDVAARLP